MMTMSNKLGLTTRDWIWIGTLVIGLIANYAGLSARIGTLERSVERIDTRLWQIAERRVAHIACPPDATVVHAVTWRAP